MRQCWQNMNDREDLCIAPYSTALLVTARLLAPGYQQSVSLFVKYAKANAASTCPDEVVDSDPLERTTVENN